MGLQRFGPSIEANPVIAAALPYFGGAATLAVAKLVAAHGGLLDFDSEPGRTVFRVLLPIATDEDLPE